MLYGLRVDDACFRLLAEWNWRKGLGKEGWVKIGLLSGSLKFGRPLKKKRLHFNPLFGKVVEKRPL